MLGNSTRLNSSLGSKEREKKIVQKFNTAVFWNTQFTKNKTRLIIIFPYTQNIHFHGQPCTVW